MESAERILDYLRNAELTEREVIGIYRRFLRKERFGGFEEGGEFVRGVLAKRRAYYDAARSKRFKLILEELEDYINAKED